MLKWSCFRSCVGHCHFLSLWHHTRDNLLRYEKWRRSHGFRGPSPWSVGLNHLCLWQDKHSGGNAQKGQVAPAGIWEAESVWGSPPASPGQLKDSFPSQPPEGSTISLQHHSCCPCLPHVALGHSNPNCGRDWVKLCHSKWWHRFLKLHLSLALWTCLTGVIGKKCDFCVCCSLLGAKWLFRDSVVHNYCS